MDILFDPTLKLSLVVNDNINSILASHNICTIKDFLDLPCNYPLKLPRTSIVKLQKHIRSKHNIPVYIHNHSWLSLSCYYSVKNKTNSLKHNIQRGIIGPLVICEHMVFIIVIGQNKKQYIRTTASIILLNELWKNCDIISDSDDDVNSSDSDDTDYKNYIRSNTNESIVNRFNQLNILPTLEIDKHDQGISKLTMGMQKCLKSILTEANRSVKLLQFVHIESIV